MAIDLQPLIDQFYDTFLDLYHRQSTGTTEGASAASGRTAQPFLAFQGIGSAITPEMFRLQDGSASTGLVTEQFSSLANMLVEVNGTTITGPGLFTADSAYGGLLAQAQPLTEADLPGLGAIKDPALRAYTEAGTEPLIHGGVEYRPALPLPPDWPLPTGDAAWASHKFSSEQTTTVTTTPPPPGPAGGIRPTIDWRWRVAPPALRETVKALGTVATTIPPKPVPAPITVPPRISFLRAPVMAMVKPATASISATLRPAIMASRIMVGEAPPVQAKPVAAMAQVVQSRVLMAQLQMVREQSQPQAVTSSSMELSFRYCLVTARRPWISGAFLTARNWFIPRLHAGEIASGTGTGVGSFEVMPAAALCVRDLKITAAWSAEERAVLPALTKFGPFSLIGSTLDAGGVSLLCPGMQIIGWVMEPMPQLPPNGDPALPAA